ncbi:MAG: 16S ribosomal RNA methyltransferase A [Nanoarchaeota archaeon]|nr:16S ribosomal RNA methyltransferase A [Nanoarchaeota archaeon]MBU4300214.1 16S ribosomal RNA methyltransferase A [Nanoarchaeota archaeon]MBU4451600.1 16S ribosomal RNA methyltransferase A [Nanoarchaeota archaeon]MCG2723122.1 16S ribosomal RNA methyltransferase A [archaeon]
MENEVRRKNISYFLETYGIRLKKSLGQNFLVDKNIIRKEAELAQIKPGETILEIGPGVGFLTRELLLRTKNHLASARSFLNRRFKSLEQRSCERIPARSEKRTAGKVIAIEFDKNLADILEKEFQKEIAEKKLEIIYADALEIDFPKFDKCVSNIPYEISSKIILKLGKCKKPAVLIIQKEFAERLIALPGAREYSKISVMSQYYFRTELLHIVSKKSFFPSPNIDSAIVRLEPQSEAFIKSLGIADESLFLKIIHALFQHKNMTVRNALIHSRGEFGLDKETAKKIAENISLKGTKVRMLDLIMIAQIAGEMYVQDI